VIDHLAVDEAQDRLLIYGTFSSTAGFVTIDSAGASILSWTDTLIACELLDTGRGSGGDVFVEDLSGRSIPRVLSIVRLKISFPLFITVTRSHSEDHYFRENRIWNVSWRVDIKHRNNNADSVVVFEISKRSFGYRGYPTAPIILPWADTSLLTDSCISLGGKLNLSSGKIIFGAAKLRSQPRYLPDTIITYWPRPISFDSTGFISGYQDSMHDDLDLSPNAFHGVYDQVILFPPSPKPLGVAFLVNLVPGFRVDNNPFSDKLSFTFHLAHRTAIRLDIYDDLGRVLCGEDLGFRNPGEFAHSLDIPSSWQRSTYYARLAAGNEVRTIKLLRQ
jgi:hypothetical protein